MPRLAAHLLLCLAVLAIAAATLTPAPDSGAARASAARFWSLGSGETATADALRNVLLFAPLGAALAARGRRARGAMALSAAASLAIELAQLGLPGRQPMAADVLANAIGAGLGASFVHAIPGARRAGAGSARAWAAGAGAALALLAPAWLATPQLPATQWFGAWNPELGHLAEHPARVLSVEIGGRPLAEGPLADSAATRRALLLGEPLVVRLDAARPGPEGALAGVVTIHDEQQREILLLGSVGTEGVVRLRTRAAALRLEPFAWHVPDLFAPAPAAAAPPSTGEEIVRIERQDLAVAAGRSRRGTAGPARHVPLRASDGWQMLVDGAARPAAQRALAGALWCALAAAPAAALAPATFPGLGAALLPLAALLAAPAFGLGATPLAAWLGAVASTTAGLLAARRGAGRH